MEADWFRRQHQALLIRRRRRRKSPYRAGTHVLRGHHYLKDQRNEFDTETHSSFDCSFHKIESSSCQSSYDMDDARPKHKKNDTIELPREEETRQLSTSVIAKLMGLDEQLPEQVGFQEKHHKPLRWLSISEHHKLKDVYEGMEMLEVEKDVKKLANEARSSSRPYKVDVSKQYKTSASSLGTNFMDVMCFPGDRSFRILKGSCNRLGCGYCCKHHLLNLFQEHNFEFSKFASRAKIENDKVCSPLERKTGRFSPVRSNALTTFRLRNKGMSGHSFKEHSNSFSPKLAQLNATVKNYKYIHPNLVLGPGVQKAYSKERKVHLNTPGNSQFSLRRWTPQSTVHGVHNGERFQPNGCKANGSRETDRKNLELKRFAVGSYTFLPVLRLNKSSRDNGSRAMFGINNIYMPEALWRSSNHPDGWKCNCASALASSPESMSEAIQNLSTRFKMSSRFKMSGYAKAAEDYGKGFCTVTELPFPSNSKARRKASHSPIAHNVSDEISNTTNMQASWSSHSTFSCGDSEEYGSIANSKSTCVPVSSTTYGIKNLRILCRFGDDHFCTVDHVLKLRPKKENQRGIPSFISIQSRNGKLKSHLGGEKNNLSTREIHVMQEKRVKNLLVKTPAEGKSELMSVPNYVDVDELITSNEKQAHLSEDNMTLKNPKVSNNDLQEALSDHNLFNHYELLKPVRRKKASQPHNVCVPDLPLREDNLGRSESLTQIRIEQRKDVNSDSCAKLSKVSTLSNEDSSEACHSLPRSGYVEEEFMNEEERDYSYLIDILITSGVHSSKQEKLSNVCYSPENPVKPSVFGKLEKKYGKLVAWSHSERKLMFDMINLVLADILAPFMDLHPWVNSSGRIGPMWGSEGLVEKTWQMLVRKRTDLSLGNPEDKVLDLQWLNLGDNIDEIGREIERFLDAKLLEEVVSEFIIG